MSNSPLQRLPEHCGHIFNLNVFKYLLIICIIQLSIFFSRAVVGSCSMRNGNKRPSGESNKHLGIVLHKKMAFPFSCGIRNRFSLEN